MNRLKIAELTSGVGALVLGIGLGALFSTFVRDLGGVITLTGLVLHALGCRTSIGLKPPAPGWITAAYWVCWVLLVLVIALLAWR